MWPWGHLASAYLVYAAYARFGRGHRPTAAATLAVAVGSQAPDLVDKPLAWTASILPTGRSLAHSLLIVVPVVVALYVLAGRTSGDDPRADRRPLAVAFGIGTVVHVFGDALYPLLRLEVSHLGFLLWPVVPPIEYEVEQSFAAHFALVEPSPELAFEFLLVVVALVVWRADGYPGLATVLSWPARALDAIGGR
jgi:hypothetical protein